MSSLKVRNKNAILELLLANVPFEKIDIVQNLDKDGLTRTILTTALEKGVRIEELPLSKMPKRRQGQTHEVIAGFIEPENQRSLTRHIDKLFENGETPLFLLINRVEFANNIGMIARTAYAAGVNGLLFQGNESDILNEETIQFSVGAICRIPIIKVSIFQAIKELQDNAIRVYALDMEGEAYTQTDLVGPMAFVLGAEDKGLSSEVMERLDGRLSIPMANGIDSMNVGVSAGIVLYEKRRQELAAQGS